MLVCSIAGNTIKLFGKIILNVLWF
jgi:hypothetical protein